MNTQQDQTLQPPPIAKSVLIEGLFAFVNQRTGIDWRDYVSDHRDTEGVKAFRQEYREILRDGRDARELLRTISWRNSITAKMLLDRSHGGRLTWNGSNWEYCTGQYFPTEYRAAVCCLCASVLWNYARSNGCNTREEILAWARKELGRGITKRWFV